ncbi:MAG TPA: hypothetical protein VH298_00275 [Jatrophihabitans sp.]|nr:hypothetical protein [Jatrophihabitans sp.]
MDDLVLLRNSVVGFARIAEGRAVITELADAEGPGRHFELCCVDPSERYARMVVALNGRDGALYLGKAVVEEYDKVSLAEFTEIVRMHVTAVVMGHIIEDRTVDPNGCLLACKTTMLLDGEEFVDRHSTLFYRRNSARRITFRYAGYRD